MLIALLNLRFYAKVYSDSASKHELAVQHLSDSDGIVGGVECADYPSHRLEWRKGVDCGMFVDCLRYRLQVRSGEDLRRLQIRDEECIAWWRRLTERRKVRKVK